LWLICFACGFALVFGFAFVFEFAGAPSFAGLAKGGRLLTLPVPRVRRK
jgi:hypothetical protein